MKKTLVITLSLIILAGCESLDKRVVTATGTTIGLKVGQEPGAPVVDTVFGYRRAEFASVPVPHEENDLDSVPNVITELYYSRSADSHLYQRLAVGREAATSDGAKYVFAKNRNGEIDANAAVALNMHSASLDENYSQFIAFIRPDGKTNSANQQALVACFEKHGLRISPSAAELQQFNLQRTADKKPTVSKEEYEFPTIMNVLVSDHFKPIRDLCAKQIDLSS